MKNKRLKKDTDNLYKIKEHIKKTPSLGKELGSKFINQNGDCVIDVVVSKENLYNSFSSANQRRLNPDIYQYIDNNAYYLPLTFSICLNFITDCNKEEQEFIRREISNHYDLLIFDKKDDVRRTTYRLAGLFIAGVILLSFYFIVEALNNGNILFVEILSIAGSFCIWGSLDAYLERTEQRIDELNYAQLGISKIEFSPLNDEKKNAKKPEKED